MTSEAREVLTGVSWTHVLAVVAGAAREDGDVYHHFGSLFGFDQHRDIAATLGLVLPECADEDTVILTDEGREFVDRFGLRALTGRANAWDRGEVEPALRALRSLA